MNDELYPLGSLSQSPADIYSRLQTFPYSFFLDSALFSEKLGRFSFIGIDPFLIFKSKKDRIEIEFKGRKNILRGNPFLVLKDLLSRFKVKKGNRSVPFTGGAVGYFSYDLKDFNELLPDFARDDLELPESFLCFYDTVLAFDHFKKHYFIASTGFPEKGRKRASRQKARLEWLRSMVLQGGDRSQLSGLASGRDLSPLRLKSNFTKTQYVEAVKKAKQYIEKGDIYQVNLSQRFTAELENTDPFYLYKVLRNINPAPFAAFLNFSDVKIASASPERFM